MQTTPGQHRVHPDAARADSSPHSKTWQSVSAYLEHDHRLLDAILTDAEAFLKEHDLEAAREYFEFFRQRLDTHIDAEEALLFPFYDLTQGRHGPTSVMRHEHGEIRQVVRALASKLSCRAGLTDALDLFEELARLLDSHNEKEERVLYPTIDASAPSARDLGVLVAHLEEFIERRAGSIVRQR